VFAPRLDALEGPHSQATDLRAHHVLASVSRVAILEVLSADGTEILLHHCPFHELAEQQRDIVCGIHPGLLRGALQQLGAPVEATRLRPFVTPRLCVAELVRRPS
jgi:predicted ArsR family transcriptional regulator